MKNLPPPPQFSLKLSEAQVKEINFWLFGIWQRLVDAGIINSGGVSGSSLLEIADRRHSLLQEILGVNVSGTETVKDKHVSDILARGWEQHRQAESNVHGVVGELASRSSVEAVEQDIQSLRQHDTMMDQSIQMLLDSDQVLRDTDAQIQIDLSTLQTDFSNHVSASSDVHGIGAGSSVVGTNTVQTLTGKTILTPVTVVSSDLTLSTENTVKITAPITIILPTAVGATGRMYTLDNAHAGVTTVTATGGQTIEGESSQTLTGECCMCLYSDGSNWRIK